MSDAPAGAVDPGNSSPEEWSEPFSPDELAELLGEVDNPGDPLVIAGLAGTLYDDPAVAEAVGGEGGGR